MIDPRHRDEWLASCVSEAIIDANVESLEGFPAFHKICSHLAQQIFESGEGSMESLYLRHKHLMEGGWWVSGLDPLNYWESMEWGQFKPDRPRFNKKREPIKYESPIGLPARAIFLDTGDEDYWYETALNASAPICLLEGAKKAGCVLSLGYPAIALPGVWMARRSHKTDGKVDNEWLIEELEPFLQPGRPFIFVFDQDTKEETRRQVGMAIDRTSALIEYRGCKTAVAQWDIKMGKGFDDLVANHGKDAGLEALTV